MGPRQFPHPGAQGHSQSRAKKTTMTTWRSRHNDNVSQGSHKPRGLSSLIDVARSLRTAHPIVGCRLPRPRRNDIVRPSSRHHRQSITTATRPPSQMERDDDDEKFAVVLLIGLCGSNKREEEQEEEQEGEGGEDSNKMDNFPGSYR